MYSLGSVTVCTSRVKSARGPSSNRTYYFFFQAEDGIRDVAVTGVQTCALPICPRPVRRPIAGRYDGRVTEASRRLGRVGGEFLDPVPQLTGLADRVDRRFSAPREIGRASCRERG